MLTAKDIKERLHSRLEQVCKHLLPAGKVQGSEFRTGSTGGEGGQSLGVCLAGEKIGMWSDFASDEKGDIFTLWMAVRNCSFAQAMREAKEFLGIRELAATNAAQIFKKPKPKNIVKLAEKPDSEVEIYLKQERKLSANAILSHRIALARGFDGKGATEIAFPCFDPSERLLNVKYQALARTAEGKKVIRQEKDCAPCMFGWQVIEPDMRSVVICEGQIDAMTWFDWGVPALSVPNGTGDTENWIDFEWDNLLQFDTIYLSFDMDEPGRKACQKVAKRLGLHRCLIVKLPHKDANECLQKGLTGEDAARFLKQALPYAPEEIKTPNEFYERILELDNPNNPRQAGLVTPILGKDFVFRPGEVTLWTGHTSHGKSSFLNQIALYAGMNGQRTVIGSFEMAGEVTCQKLVKCLSLTNPLEKQTIKACLQWLTGKVWVYDLIGLITQEKLFELCSYSVQRHGVGHIVIDSLMKCDINSDDYEAQRKFLNQLIAFCHEHNVHGHIVAHPRKGQSVEHAPDLMDVMGGGSVVYQPDNVIAVWRNNKKEEKREDNQLGGEEDNTTPDTIAYIRKQRFSGRQYKVNLWYKPECCRFTTNHMGGEPLFHDWSNFYQLPEILE